MRVMRNGGNPAAREDSMVSPGWPLSKDRLVRRGEHDGELACGSRLYTIAYSGQQGSHPTLHNRRRRERSLTNDTNSHRRMHAGDFVIQPAAFRLREFPYPARRRDLRAAWGKPGVAGALSVFEARSDVEIVPAISARSGSAGLLSAAGWQRLSTEIMDRIRRRSIRLDAVYFSLHGAMGADGELDPEGYLLKETRALVGATSRSSSRSICTASSPTGCCDRSTALRSTIPIRMSISPIRGGAPRELLLRLIDRPVTPVIARVVIPALVRGDELITKSRLLRRSYARGAAPGGGGTALAAGIMIGNPFTDVPELCCQVLVMTDGDAAAAEREAMRLAAGVLAAAPPHAGQVDPARARHRAGRTIGGPVIFTDAADATSSGATGDCNIDHARL